MQTNAGRNAMLVKSGYTAKDYVQDGLIAMWDGIENAGWSVHDPNATVWKDLTGRGNDFTIEHGSFTDNALDTSIHSYADNSQACAIDSSDIKTAIANNLLTVELVFQLVDTDSGRRGVFGLTTMNNFNTSAGLYNMHLSDGGWACWRGSYRLWIPDFSMLNASTFVFNGGRTLYYKNGGKYTSSDHSGTGINTIGSFGLNTVGPVGGGARIVYNSVRLRNIALTADKIAYNYFIDKERFNLP